MLLHSVFDNVKMAASLQKRLQKAVTERGVIRGLIARPNVVLLPPDALANAHQMIEGANRIEAELQPLYDLTNQNAMRAFLELEQMIRSLP